MFALLDRGGVIRGRLRGRKHSGAFIIVRHVKYLKHRADRGSDENFRAALRTKPDAEPDESNRL